MKKETKPCYKCKHWDHRHGCDWLYCTVKKDYVPMYFTCESFELGKEYEASNGHS